MIRTILLACCVAFLTGILPAGEFESRRLDNWHQWRGPDANGVAPRGNPPVTWSEQQNIRWKVALPGSGSSSPIVWGDRVFLTTAIKTDRTIELPPAPPAAEGDAQRRRRIEPPSNYYQFVVLCLDRATGAVRWQQIATEEVPHEGHHPDHGYASASPTTDGERLYVSFGSRGIYCYDLDGHLQWKRDFGDMETYASFGEGTSPVIHGDALIINWDHQGDSFIACLDPAKGETKWRVERDPATTWATPLIVEYQGRTQVVTNATKRTRSYDLATGELIWECGGQVASAIPCPVTRDGLVYCMTGFRGSALYAIPLDARGDITDSEKIAWHRHQGTPYVPSPLLYGDLLFFTQSNGAILSCLNPATGEPVMERQRLEGLKGIYASPVGAAERVYIIGRDGVTLVIRRSAQLEILATNKLDEPLDASPAIVGRELFLRGPEHLYSIVAE